MFEISSNPLDVEEIRSRVLDPAAGGLCVFEGWVRNHHQGRAVLKLEYESYAALAEKEGKRIIDEVFEKFEILHAACVHRVGELDIGGLAVVICVSSAHRDPAFEACRYIIEEVKSRVPVWKKEFFEDGTSGWVRCDHAETPRGEGE